MIQTFYCFPPPQEEKSKPDVNLKDIKNEDEIDDPLMILKAILLQVEGECTSSCVFIY